MEGAGECRQSLEAPLDEKIEGPSPQPKAHSQEQSPETEAHSQEESPDTSASPAENQQEDRAEEDPQATPRLDSEPAEAPLDETDDPSPETEARSQEESPELCSIQPKYSPSRLMCLAFLGLLLAVVVSSLFSQPPPERAEVPRVDIFLREMERARAQFPSQRAELWRRTRIHLERHLQMARPTEPVSLMLTSGRGAQQTLRCLARRLALAFSSALNGSVLHIDGAGTAGQDSDRVKMDLDRRLSRAFGGDQPVAVVHRFEELPPSAAIIFYRYCDHENAAYKHAFLAFTVLLPQEEVRQELGLKEVEELVQDYVKDRFVDVGRPDSHASFNRMDVDKLSGLWSRISHLILPVAAEESIEQTGCME